MADFFKGLAGGFQTGLQFGNAMQQREERERLREAMGLAPQEVQQRQASPEELGRAQAETRGLAAQDAEMFGLGPQEQAAYAPQMPVEGQRIGPTQYGLGGQTFSRMPTQQEIESARYSAAANVLAERDPAAAMRMRQEQVRMQREAEEAPLRQEALRTQVEAGKLGLKKGGFELTAAERAAADAKKMDDFSAWRSQNPQADFAAMSAKAQELGMSTDAQFKIASNLTGIKEQEFKASQQRIQELVKDQGLDGMLKAHKESKDLDPNSHFEVTRGQGGKITLNRVNTATGEIIQPNVFSGSEAETTAYLNKQATNPATVIDYTLNLAKAKSGLEKDAAAIEASKATTNLYSVRAKGLQADDATQARLKDIRDQFTTLTADQKLGPEGRALEREYNMITAGPGKQLALGAAPRAERPEVTASAVASYAKDLVGKPSGEMKDGKPVRYTAETAAAAARRALSAQDGAAADPADALIEAMRKNAPAQQQATPAGQGLINLSNTMLPPAAPVRAAPTTSQERLRGLYLGQ